MRNALEISESVVGFFISVFMVIDAVRRKNGARIPSKQEMRYDFSFADDIRLQR